MHFGVADSVGFHRTNAVVWVSSAVRAIPVQATALVCLLGRPGHSLERWTGHRPAHIHTLLGNTPISSVGHVLILSFHLP